MDFNRNIMKLTRVMREFSAETSVDDMCQRLEPVCRDANMKDRTWMLFLLLLNTDIIRDYYPKNMDNVFYTGTRKTLSLNEFCSVIVNLKLFSELGDIVRSGPADMSIEIIKCLNDRNLGTENKYNYSRELAIALYDKYINMISCVNEEHCNSLFDVFLMVLPCSYKSVTDVNCQMQIWQHCLSCRTVYYNPVFMIDSSPEEVNVSAPVGRVQASFSEFLSDFRYISEESDVVQLESAYSLYETIKDRKIVEPDVEEWLKSIAKKPEVSGIHDNHGIPINSPNQLDKEEASLVMKHLNDMVLDDLKTIVESLQSGECTTFADEIYVKCLERMPVKDQITYLNRHFERRRRYTGDVTEDLTEKFNKLTDENAEGWLITACIMSPSMTITKIVKSALTNPDVMRRCVGHLKMLRSACLSEEDDFSIITGVVKKFVEGVDLTEQEMHHLIPFTRQLQEVELLDFKFVKACVLDFIRKSLISDDLDKAIFGLELLRSSLKLVRSNEVTVAGFMVRVLSHTSWDSTTFSMQLAHARELVVSISNTLMKSSFNDFEKTWLTQEILKSSEVNQSYFCDFLSPDDVIITSKELHLQLLTLLHTKTKINAIIDSIANKFQSLKFLQLRAVFSHALIKVLPILTTEEWFMLFTRLQSILTSWSIDGNLHAGLAVVDLLTLSMYCLAQDMNHYGDTFSCFEFCVRNYGRVVQRHFVGADVRTELANKILFLLNGIRKSSIRKSCSMILSCVFLEISTDEDVRDWFKREFIQQ